MAESQFNSVVFKDTTFGNILEDIYVNSKKRSTDIDLMINELRMLITTPQQALILVPVLTQYIGKALDNDSHLIKMAAIVEKATARNVIIEETSSLLSNAEFQEIKQLSDSYGNMLFDKNSPLKAKNDNTDKQQ